jgi:hypothetical protein
MVHTKDEAFAFGIYCICGLFDTIGRWLSHFQSRPRVRDGRELQDNTVPENGEYRPACQRMTRREAIRDASVIAAAEGGRVWEPIMPILR